jgi:hypothetical protein
MTSLRKRLNPILWGQPALKHMCFGWASAQTAWPCMVDIKNQRSLLPQKPRYGTVAVRFESPKGRDAMRQSKTLLTAIIIASATSLLASAQTTASDTATISFNAKNAIMSGSLYGITAVDEAPQTFGNRNRVAIAAGQRTIWYTCPFGHQSKLTQEFSAGAMYELVCKPGQLAEIKRVDDC